jgi:decaprenylphospho-beta-D-ribofuranose 2-oxidase
MSNILKKISASKKGSFLAVLKATGKANNNYLSFPLEGYSLALDFKLDTSIFKLLDLLDDIVLDYGGRVYLTKDARMSEHTFKKSYPQWEAFTNLRAATGADKAFTSLQAIRLGI